MQQGLSPLMPVFAVKTRLGPWIKVVQYLAENMETLHDFTATLPPFSKAVRDLKDLLEVSRKLLKVQATFIVEHSSDIPPSQNWENLPDQ